MTARSCLDPACFKPVALLQNTGTRWLVVDCRRAGEPDALAGTAEVRRKTNRSVKSVETADFYSTGNINTSTGWRSAIL